jgi:hypothetical protein
VGGNARLPELLIIRFQVCAALQTEWLVDQRLG